MKLHLGCGQRYLEGYVNIDFPSSSHSVQEKSVADLHTDILTLHYPGNSIEEVRLHHTFEHFPRPVACALLACWFSWLKQGGVLHIEVPDFARTARVILTPFASLKKQAVAERHLFGSHEAPWAVHCESYTPGFLKKMLESFGFKVLRTKKNSWRGTYNFEILAEKTTAPISQQQFNDIAARYLRNYLLDEGQSESRLLNVWLDSYNEQVAKCWAEHE